MLKLSWRAIIPPLHLQWGGGCNDGTLWRCGTLLQWNHSPQFMGRIQRAFSSGPFFSALASIPAWCLSAEELLVEHNYLPGVSPAWQLLKITILEILKQISLSTSTMRCQNNLRPWKTPSCLCAAQGLWERLSLDKSKFLCFPDVLIMRQYPW